MLLNIGKSSKGLHKRKRSGKKGYVGMELVYMGSVVTTGSNGRFFFFEIPPLVSRFPPLFVLLGPWANAVSMLTLKITSPRD